RRSRAGSAGCDGCSLASAAIKHHRFFLLDNHGTTGTHDAFAPRLVTVGVDRTVADNNFVVLVVDFPAGIILPVMLPRELKVAEDMIFSITIVPVEVLAANC